MPETPVAPARFARRTKDRSKETKTAPGGLLLKCIASANSTPWSVSASAATMDGLSSACTFLRPSNFVKASRMALSSNPYRRRRTQPVSSNTVFAIQIGPAASRDLAAAACLGSSCVSSRTTTSVSTAVMTPHHLTSNSRTHLRQRLRFAFGPQTADDLVEIGYQKTDGGTQQNALTGFFDGELRAGAHRPGNAYGLGQDDLAFGGEPGGFHR